MSSSPSLSGAPTRSRPPTCPHQRQAAPTSHTLRQSPSRPLIGPGSSPSKRGRKTGQPRTTLSSARRERVQSLDRIRLLHP
ncbi:unnamed protein product [Protopolystoma xenopodis]|uniref:Uncharacterized protein n=1 Tax=Protopolystoma xenopodis TaxID=117903 RepID=A0A448WNA4_9PLAT|nr:unnamed protein product [Protopolystoma xenopodis]